jgi:UDP-N-acetyl-D-galactosamine dehydrogenase
MSEYKIAIIGLGYVGLPLAVELAKKFPVVGFDINQKRVNELSQGIDHTLEASTEDLKSVIVLNNGVQTSTKGLYFSCLASDMAGCNTFIVTVPTPTDKHNSPDLTPLIKASETIGSVLKQNDLVIYESTVYPGVTEEECVPVLEKVSGLKLNTGFFAGYSPERINPGDKEHTVTTIKKVTSGSTPEAAERVDILYRSIIKAGTHKASSIKVAEAAKVIENSQRDINIAFVNELAKIFNRLGIDTSEVLAAAGTKWNFINFKPGLVGGHCIGVDPYYLAQKAQETGYNPEIILAGRRMNDGMGAYVAQETVKLMVKKSILVKNASILLLGFTFKENCPDVRNTKVVDIYKTLQEYDTQITVFDPWANPAEVMHEYWIKTINKLEQTDKNYDAIILAVSHKQFESLNLQSLMKPNAVIYDVKSVLPKSIIDARL